MTTLIDNLGYVTNQVEDLEVRLAGLQIEVDNLAEENGHFANFLEHLDYTPFEIDSIAGGWCKSKAEPSGAIWEDYSDGEILDEVMKRLEVEGDDMTGLFKRIDKLNSNKGN